MRVPVMMRLLLAWTAGIILNDNTNLYLWAGMLVACLLCGMFAYVRREASHDVYSGVSIMLLFAALGFGKAAFVDTVPVDVVVRKGWHEVEVLTEGVVKTNSIRYEVKALPSEKKYMLYWKQCDAPLRLGEDIRIWSRIYPLNDSVSYHRSLAHEGFSGTMVGYRSSGGDASSQHPMQLKTESAKGREWCQEKLDEATDDAEVKALAMGCLLGSKAQLSQATKNAFSNSGMSHILAVSGLHVGIILLIIGWLLSPLKWLLLHRSLMVFSMVALWGYVAFIGFPVSAIRAAVMLTMVQLASLFQREAYSWHVLALTALIMLVYNTQWLYSLSFQLSFLATAGILIVKPELKRLREWSKEQKTQRRKSHYRREKIACTLHLIGGAALSVVLVTMAAQLATLPMILYIFHHLPWLGIVPSFLVLPVMTFYVLGVVAFWGVCGLESLCAVGGVFMDPLKHLVWMCTEALSHWILGVAHMTQQADAGIVIGSEWRPDAWEVGIAYGVLGYLAMWWRHDEPRYLIIALLLVIATLCVEIVKCF